jgi:predicted DNA-binding protein (MmcQ/YjbR family)
MRIVARGRRLPLPPMAPALRTRRNPESRPPSAPSAQRTRRNPESRPPSAPSARWLAKIRKLCLSLPGTVEKSSWGHPNWAAGRIYAAFEQYGGRPSLCALASREEQSLLVLDDRLFVPPYVGSKGWVGVWLDKRPAWSLVAALLRAAHEKATAPARAPAAKPPMRSIGKRVRPRRRGRAL